MGRGKWWTSNIWCWVYIPVALAVGCGTNIFGWIFGASKVVSDSMMGVSIPLRVGRLVVITAVLYLCNGVALQYTMYPSTARGS